MLRQKMVLSAHPPPFGNSDTNARMPLDEIKTNVQILKYTVINPSKNVQFLKYTVINASKNLKRVYSLVSREKALLCPERRLPCVPREASLVILMISRLASAKCNKNNENFDDFAVSFSKKQQK